MLRCEVGCLSECLLSPVRGYHPACALLHTAGVMCVYAALGAPTVVPPRGRSLETYAMVCRL